MVLHAIHGLTAGWQLRTGKQHLDQKTRYQREHHTERPLPQAIGTIHSLLESIEAVVDHIEALRHPFRAAVGGIEATGEILAHALQAAVDGIEATGEILAHALQAAVDGIEAAGEIPRQTLEAAVNSIKPTGQPFPHTLKMVVSRVKPRTHILQTLEDQPAGVDRTGTFRAVASSGPMVFISNHLSLSFTFHMRGVDSISSVVSGATPRLTLIGTYGPRHPF